MSPSLEVRRRRCEHVVEAAVGFQRDKDRCPDMTFSLQRDYGVMSGYTKIHRDRIK